MPSFWAMSPVRMTNPPLQLDLDVDAGSEIELHQRVHRLRRRIDDVENPLVGADLELLARLLVDMRRAVDRELLDLGRQRNRPAHARAGPFRRVDDLARRLIEDTVVVRSQPDTDILVFDRHRRYLIILATTPAPTVWPTSRMAKR